MRDEWAPDRSDNYRAAFLAMEHDQAIAHMLTGIGVLSKAELAGERIFTAYDNQDQEDEHSCFSDNTHRDIINNLVGINNVYTGQYRRVDGSLVSGPGLGELLAEKDPALHAQILAQLEQTAVAVENIHVPFDQAIALPHTRPHVLQSVRLLQRLGNHFAQAATALGLRINTALPI